MKLRIKDDSIRLRLEQKEVEALVLEGQVICKCTLGDSELLYSIEAYKSEDMIAMFADRMLKVQIPASWIENWHQNNEVGFDTTMTNGTSILVEKDFKCLIPRTHEDESDMYANPRSNV